MQIEVLNHASIKITSDKIYYFDPYKIDKKMSDADYIFIAIKRCILKPFFDIEPLCFY